MSNYLEQMLNGFTHTRIDTPPIRLKHYPHLIGGESDLWDMFLLMYPNFFSSVSYDVRVGNGVPIKQEWESPIQKMARDLSQKRIDVIGEKDGVLWIIELKIDPTIRIIGQLEGYSILFLNQLGKQIKIRLTMIANKMDGDLQTVLTAKKIEWFVV
ncbi:MAG: hypothetical protein M0R06_10535 [Sphaerochaeta sp.]|jgi:hypothetical protein|nr:hypothetical protein [Sphaerochaeta sp.]